MKRLLFLTCTILVALPSAGAQAQSRTQYEALVASHASANQVPEALVHRVIVRESKYHPGLVGRGGTIGLMQIKLATARGVGYIGDAAGLRDPDTNLAYGIKYLAGAYRAANGDHARAMRYYAGGYYYAAKQQRRERVQPPMLASAPPQVVVTPNETALKPIDIKPKQASVRPKPSKNPADAKAQVPRPPVALSAGANAPKPR